MKKALVLINPSSGNRNSQPNLCTIVETLAIAGYEILVNPIIPSRKMYAEYAIEKYGEDVDLVVCVGGDGTLNHTIQAMMTLNNKPLLGCVPRGSTNDFAKTMKLPRRLSAAMNTIVDGVPFSYDIGKFNDMYFNYVAAFGAFSELSYSTDQNAKNILGHAAYALNALFSYQKQMKTSCHLKITTDSFSLEGDYLMGMFFNATSIGGIGLLYTDDIFLDDGVMEMLLIKAPKNRVIEVPQIITSLLANNLKNDNIEYHQFRYAKIESRDAIPWTHDGEFAGNHKSINLEVMQRAITLMVPNKK